MAGAAATIGSMHTCPMVTGTVPHVGGPIIGPGVPTVLIGGKPAAVMGDTVTCAGPPDTIVQGESTVLIGGKPAATVGCMTAHGGVITSGEPTVLIGTGGSGATATMPVKKIPFPDISFVSKVKAAFAGKSKTLAEAQANQAQLRNAERPVINVSNLQWKKDGSVADNALVGETVLISADVEGVDEGAYVCICIFEKDTNSEDDYVDSVLAKVENSRVEKEWKVKYVKDDDDIESAAEMQQKNYTMPEFVFKYDNSDGETVESNVLEVVDALEIKAIDDETGEPLAGYDYAICLPNGDFITGTLDDAGYAKIESLSPLVNYPVVLSKEDKIIGLTRH